MPQTIDLAAEVRNLDNLPTAKLLERYIELFKEKPSSHHRLWLIKRLAWRIQAKAEGGITQRAKNRARLLADEADLRVRAPAAFRPAVDPGPKAKVPFTPQSPCQPALIAGTILTRTFKGVSYQVTVLQGPRFSWNGTTYGSISAVAKAITGTSWNGYRFFGLKK